MIRTFLVVASAAGSMSRAGLSVLGREESRRAIWRGGGGVLGTGQRLFRPGNREGEAVSPLVRPITVLPMWFRLYPIRWQC
jgi:hypothetical protein